MACTFCGKIYTKKSREVFHQNRCHFNPNRKKGSNQFYKDKNFTWSAETRRKISNSLTGDQNPAKKSEVRNKISQTVIKKAELGDWHFSLANRHIYEYKGIKFQGSWEAKYAKWLDFQEIKWRRPKETFSYTLDGKEHRYTPDFYLIDEQTYVEIKGYKTRKDEAKWLQFPLKLKVLMKEDLKKIIASID